MYVVIDAVDEHVIYYAIMITFDSDMNDCCDQDEVIEVGLFRHYGTEDPTRHCNNIKKVTHKAKAFATNSIHPAM